MSQITDSLLSGAIPTGALLIGGTVIKIVGRQRAGKRTLHERVSHLEEALLGTEDLRGQPKDDGLLDQFAEMKQDVAAIKTDLGDVKVGVAQLLENGVQNGHTH